MKIRTFLLLVTISAMIAFALLNWNQFTEKTTLSLGFTAIAAPLGLVMLILTASITALFLIYLVYLQTTALLDIRRHSRELEASRKLADQAEASRFTELRNFIEVELQKITATSNQATSAILKDLDQARQGLHAEIEQSTNSLSAYIGELEDRVETFQKSNP